MDVTDKKNPRTSLWDLPTTCKTVIKKNEVQIE